MLSHLFVKTGYEIESSDPEMLGMQDNTQLSARRHQLEENYCLFLEVSERLQNNFGMVRKQKPKTAPAAFR